MKLPTAYGGKRAFIKVSALLVFVFSVLVLPATPAHASTSFSGQVTDTSSALISGATVTISENPGQTTPTPADVVLTTDSSGNYSTTLTTGHTYNFVFTPPSGSSLVGVTYFRYLIPATSGTLNAVLRAATHTVSGVLQDSNSLVLPNESVHVNDGIGDVGEATTDSSGAYTMTVPANNKYLLRIDATRTDPSAVVPLTFTWWEPLDLSTADQIINKTFQGVTLTAAVRDTAGAVPVSPAGVTMGSIATQASFTDPITNLQRKYGRLPDVASTQTDTSGNFTIMVLASSGFSITATGDVAQGYGNITNSSGTIGTSSATLTLTLPTNRKTVSGIIRVSQNGSSVVVPGVQVQLRDTVYTTRVWTTTTNSLGAYSITAAGGTNYKEYLSYTGTSLSDVIPGTLNSNFTLDLSVDRANVTPTIPFNSIGIYTEDSFKQPVTASVQITVSATYNMGIGVTGAGTMSVTFSGSFSSVGSATTGVSGTWHERYIPYTNPVSIVAASTGYGQSSVSFSPSVNKSGIVTTLTNTAGGPSFVAGSTTPKPYLDYTSYALPTNFDHFNIYRNGVLIDTTTNKYYTDNSATAPGRYYYQVSTVFTSGMQSTRSATILILQ